jgi:hypothetical protein
VDKARYLLLFLIVLGCGAGQRPAAPLRAAELRAPALRLREPDDRPSAREEARALAGEPLGPSWRDRLLAERAEYLRCARLQRNPRTGSRGTGW